MQKDAAFPKKAQHSSYKGIFYFIVTVEIKEDIFQQFSENNRNDHN